MTGLKLTPCCLTGHSNVKQSLSLISVCRWKYLPGHSPESLESDVRRVLNPDLYSGVCVFTYFTHDVSTEGANTLTVWTHSRQLWLRFEDGLDNYSVTLPPQSLLDEPNPNSPANSQAAQLYQENKREYEKRVSAIVEQSWRDSWPQIHTSSLMLTSCFCRCLVEKKYLLFMGLFLSFLCTLLLVQDCGFVFLVHD